MSDNTVDFSKIKEFIDENNNNNVVNNKKETKIKNKNKRKVVLSIISFVLLFLGISLIGIFCYLKYQDKTEVLSIEVLSYDSEKDVSSLKIVLNKSVTKKIRYCNDIKEIDNSCLIDVNIKDNDLEIKDSFYTPYHFLISDYIKEPLLLETKEKVYMGVDETYKLNVTVKNFGKELLLFSSTDNSIVEVADDGTISSKKAGSAKIKVKSLDKEIEVPITVSSLIVKAPKHFDYDKKYLSCKRYSSSEAKELDDILYFKIDEAGYKTRAGVVAAARFLALEFPYRIDYFFENGRVSNTGSNMADGEGRYYHRGLYLHSDKFSDIKYTYAGKAIWGCPLMNYEDAGIWRAYTYMPNGLDCSGFVAWALLNGGFDVGDRGAGENEELPYQMTDLGERKTVTKSLIDSGKVKAGDLVNWWGHIGIIIGIDDKKYYVAESLDTYLGLVVKEYKKEDMPDDWTFIMLMDSVYEDDGNYTPMWY